jgi:hypothetical protein
MTYFEAALLVLRASQEPLTTREILEQIQARNLITTTGKTPLATLSAALYRHLGKHAELEHLSERGFERAIRGTVYWTVHSPTVATH